MTIGMQPLIDALPTLRAFAESLMTDSCRITRPGIPVTDPATGETRAASSVLYEGRCKIQTAGGVASENTEGGVAQALGALIPQWGLYLHLPATVTGLMPGDVATVTESRDPAFGGRRYRLVNMQSEKSHATARRWHVREVPDGSAR